MKEKIGIIGVGNWGTKCFNTLQDMNYDVHGCFRDYIPMLEDNTIKSILITSDASTHYEIAKKCLKYGKHIFVEKPITLSYKHTEELVNLGKKHKKVVMSGDTLHTFNPAIKKIKHDFDYCMFGRPFKSISYCTGGPRRDDINPMWEYCPHDISMLMYIVNEVPEVKSVVITDNMSKLELYFPQNNMFAECYGGWGIKEKQRSFFLSCDRYDSGFYEYPKRTLFYTNRITNKSKKKYISDTKPLTEELKCFLGLVYETEENNKYYSCPYYNGLYTTYVLEEAQKLWDKE